MLDAKLILYAVPFLKLCSFKESRLKGAIERLDLSENKGCDLVNYLKERGAVKYTQIEGRGFSGITGFELTAIGHEVAAGKRNLTYERSNKSVNVNGRVQNLAQVTGDNAKITQIADKTKFKILKTLIESDKGLDPEKRSSLLETLYKFDKIKETGTTQLI